VGAVTVGGVGTINQVNGYFKDAGGELEPNIFTFPLPHNPLDRGDHRPETYDGTPGAIPPGIPPTDLTPYNYPQLFPGNVAPPFDHHIPVFNSEDNTRNWRQDQQLSNDETRKLKDANIDVHQLKGVKNSSKRDLFKDENGNIYVKPKGGQSEGEETGLNIREF
jgi:Bacterial toxin 33